MLSNSDQGPRPLDTKEIPHVKGLKRIISNQ